MRRFVVLFVFAAVCGTATPAAASSIVLRPPVDAPVADPFRAPDGPYGSGNRGIEYATSSGDPVRAAAPGVVVFAGAVAGQTWVTIEHGGGVKTSYGPLEARSVGRDDTVRRGERIGTASGALHFSARIHGTYVDPAQLFGELVIDVRLVPHSTNDDPAVEAAHRRAERLALYDLAQERGREGGLIGAISRWLAGAAGAVSADELLAGLVETLDIAVALADGLDPDALVAELVGGLAAILDPPPCSSGAEVAAAAAIPAARRRVAVVVDGLGSASTAPGFGGDVGFDELGYASDDVVRFSYAGGLTPGGGAQWTAEIPRSHYTGNDTGTAVRDSVEAFIETVRAVRAANPDAEIDIYGHSLGGVIARLASAQLDVDVDLSVVMTFASPHSGAPLATIKDALGQTLEGSVVEGGLDLLDPGSVLHAPSVVDLSEAGYVGDMRDHAFPEGVHAVTVGHRSDLIVPGTEADAPGAPHVIVGGFDPWAAHGTIGTLPEVRDEIRLALVGLPPSCQSPTDAILDLVTGVTVATTERAIGASLMVTDVAAGGVEGQPR